MKRSEIVKIIEDSAMDLTDGSCIDGDGILMLLEMTGMLPPEIKNPRVKYTSRLKYADEKALADIYGYRFKYAQEDYCVYEWEPEE